MDRFQDNTSSTMCITFKVKWYKPFPPTQAWLPIIEIITNSLTGCISNPDRAANRNGTTTRNS
ncbi:hypothetical protein [Microcoleus sp. FACHB-831]|uniref:hypothetical protein n=1 Tax=Microcoleus sp. FACHB-831 TaxID=2692827 RepID=UPI0016882E5A|nr:hypothetical protein [Microcoleus sp. FACHB-831]